jgi:hypothetical protein
MIKVGDSCGICKFGTIKFKTHSIGENQYENLRCDGCGARYCQDCGGTLNVRGSSCVYKDQCHCEAGEPLVDKDFVFNEDDLEEL